MNVLLEWALASSLLTLVVLGIRALLKEKISLRSRYALWLLLAVRLLVPIRLPFTLPAALPEVPDTWSILSEDVVFWERPMSSEMAGNYTVNLPETVDNNQIGNAGAAVSTGPGQSPAPDETAEAAPADFNSAALGDVVLVLWGLGAVCVALAVVWSNLRFWRRLRSRRTPLPLEGSPLTVYTAEGLPSPCLVGVFRPAVYLTPEAAADETVRTHVLAHELTHYAHRDHLWAAARCLCLALHWYNPLVWLAASLSRRDGELACDEGAVARLGERERIPYGKTLVGLVARRAVPADLFSCSTAMTGGKKTVQQRIELLVKKPETVKTALFAAVSLLVLCLVFVFARGTRSEYEAFLDRVESAQSIGVGQPPFSSVAFPAPITDTELRQQARELLRQAEPVRDTEEDFSDAFFIGRRITLKDREDGPGVAYRLYSKKDVCYLAEDGKEWDSPFVPFATLPQGTAGALELLARRQNRYDNVSVVIDPAQRLALESDAYEPDQEEELLFSHSYQDQRIFYLVKVTHQSHAAGFSHLLAGVWDSEKQHFENVYDLGGDEGLYSAWTTEDGALYLLCANSTTYQGFTTSHTPLWLKFEDGELTKLTTLPDIARMSRVELPSDEEFLDESYANVWEYSGHVGYWYDHKVVPGGSGFTLYRRTPGWDNIGFHNVPQWQEMGYVHLAEVDEVANGPYVWGHGLDFTLDLSRRGAWETNLRAVVTRERGAMMRQTMEFTGENGGIRTLYINSEFATFVLDEWDPDLNDPSDYGKTIAGIYSSFTPDKTVELSSWFRVIKDGQIIPGTARFSDSGVFTFTFDQPLGLPYVGAQVIVEIGPEYGLQS